MGIIATPLGWIMKGCYFVCKNYGIALLLFTILTRLIVFPLNVKQQKSTARMTMASIMTGKTARSGYDDR